MNKSKKLELEKIRDLKGTFMKNERLVICSKKGSSAVITIQNPPVNTLSLEVVQQLINVLEEIEMDDDIAVVIITGIGEKAFVAGGI